MLARSYGRSCSIGQYICLGKSGAYHYSYALATEDALLEAQNCRAAIEEAGVALELPVFFDMEDVDGYKREHSKLFLLQFTLQIPII